MSVSQGICGRHLEAQVFCRQCAHVLREEGRVAGIREAIAIIAALTVGLDRAPLLSKLQALLPPPSGGEKAECTCNLIWTFYAGSDAGRAARNACPVHAPKPAAEKP